MSLPVIPISAFYDNYIWLVMHPRERLCFVVDPGDAKPVLNYLENNDYTLSAILITHHHHDHTGGLKNLIKKAKQIKNLPVYGSPKTKNRFINTRVKQGDMITLLNTNFEIIETPGHTNDHISYYSASQNMLFCGDTLFSAGCGRLFEGTPETLLQSLHRLASKPSETRVFCTHEYTQKNLEFAMQVEPSNSIISAYYQQILEKRKHNQPSLPSTLGIEKAINPFLRSHLSSTQAAVSHYANSTINDPKETFTLLRRWKDDY